MNPATRQNNGCRSQNPGNFAHNTSSDLSSRLRFPSQASTVSLASITTPFCVPRFIFWEGRWRRAAPRCSRREDLHANERSRPVLRRFTDDHGMQEATLLVNQGSPYRRMLPVRGWPLLTLAGHHRTPDAGRLRIFWKRLEVRLSRQNLGRAGFVERCV